MREIFRPPKPYHIFPFLDNVKIELHELRSERTIAVLGLPYEGIVNSRFGTYIGPRHIRSCSDLIESRSSIWDIGLEELPILDLGDLWVPPHLKEEKFVEYVQDKLEELELIRFKGFLILGGDHSITYPIVRYLNSHVSDLTILYLDAHLDFHDRYLNRKYSYASVVRRLSEHGLNVIICGTRTYAPEELDIQFPVFGWKPHEGWDDRLFEILSGVDTPIYLSIDLDVFEFGLSPGVGNPVSGGIDWYAVKSLLEILRTGKLLGADIVELNPMFDVGCLGGVLASELARELIVLLSITGGV